MNGFNRNPYLNQFNNVEVVQFFQDGYLLVNPLQRTKYLGLLPLGCFRTSGRRPACKND